MNIKAILREIDAEIEKLQRIRLIFKGLLEPKPRQIARTRRARVKRPSVVEIKPEPHLIVLPPKQKREYTHRIKPNVIEPKALAAPVSNRPVFVPKTVVQEPRTATIIGAANDLEATIRQNLMGIA